MFVRVSQPYIQFSQKLLVSTIIFLLLSLRVGFPPGVLFSDEAWRLLPGETSINLRKKTSLHFTGRTPKQRKITTDLKNRTQLTPLNDRFQLTQL